MFLFVASPFSVREDAWSTVVVGVDDGDGRMRLWMWMLLHHEEEDDDDVVKEWT